MVVIVIIMVVIVIIILLLILFYSYYYLMMIIIIIIIIIINIINLLTCENYDGNWKEMVWKVNCKLNCENQTFSRGRAGQGHTSTRSPPSCF